MRVLRWLRNHPVLVAVAVAILIPLVLGLHWSFWPSVPAVSADEVQSIEVYLIFWKNERDGGRRREETTVTTTDPAQIRALLNVFKTAERARDHDCANSGTITIRKKDGSVEEVYILPGHDPAYYEYRYGSRINRVDREQFLAALKTIGVQQIKLSPP